MQEVDDAINDKCDEEHCIVKSTFANFGIINSTSFQFITRVKEKAYNLFSCNSGFIMPKHYVDDGCPDCLHEEDETRFKSTLASRSFPLKLLRKNQFPPFNQRSFL